eukprot:CAMPEP_0181107334 /NCGR_PEP_ID=MMETSP1071-20121207/17033_1 /TAXON_ID=35127 /ORGANISM="Thalassiosira sp., Strain NH16" /LENGTH=43 /DNA_ID= /DNA_START= /DNA_END= /DNA_ORIENTATION=
MTTNPFFRTTARRRQDKTRNQRQPAHDKAKITYLLVIGDGEQE